MPNFIFQLDSISPVLCKKFEIKLLQAYPGKNQIPYNKYPKYNISFLQLNFYIKI